MYIIRDTLHPFFLKLIIFIIGLSNEYVSHILSPASSSTSTSSDDSDVRVLDEAIDLRMNTDMPSVGPHTINMPGKTHLSSFCFTLLFYMKLKCKVFF